MLDTATITEVDSSLPATLAFRIDGEVTRDDMTRLSERMLDAFEAHEQVDLLLIFDRFDGAETGARLSAPALKAQAASLWNVRAYVVAGAPDRAASLVESMGKVLPVEAKSFATEDEARAYLASLTRLA